MRLPAATYEGGEADGHFQGVGAVVVVGDGEFF
jgi:hypothetical protein